MRKRRTSRHREAAGRDRQTDSPQIAKSSPPPLARSLVPPVAGDRAPPWAPTAPSSRASAAPATGPRPSASSTPSWPDPPHPSTTSGMARHALSSAPIRGIPPICSDSLTPPLAESARSNRAFCYSQLELHKHVVKDCDRALQLDPALLQAYVLKGSRWLHII